jgi:hypothetical protein
MLLFVKPKSINTDDGETAQGRRLNSRGTAGTLARPSYIVQASTDDETFVINGEVFKAKTYWVQFREG